VPFDRLAPLGAVAAEDGEGWSDSENEAAEALRWATALTAKAAGDAASSASSAPKRGSRGDRSWRAGLEALKKERPYVPDPQRSGKLTQEQVQTSIRKALESGDWSEFFIGYAPRNADMSAVLKRLEAEEVVQVFKALVDKHEAVPRKQVLCIQWIMQLLQHHADTLIDHGQANAVLKQFLVCLEKRVGHGSFDVETKTCLGKWRLIAELGAVRATAVQENERASAETSTAAPSAPSAAAADDDEDDSSEEDEDAADDAGANVANDDD